MIDIIIPTFNNLQLLQPCLVSIINNRTPVLNKIIVVNNGHEGIADYIKGPKIDIVQMKENRGWEGGLVAGLRRLESDYVVFMNDDTHVPPFSSTWLQRMLVWFRDPSVGAVGPGTNVVMGLQNIFAAVPHPALEVKYLIGFCMMLKRSLLDSVGGVDDTLPGGDDLDLSIRLRKSDKRLIALRSLFIYHHGFKTGQKVHGADCNSQEMTDRTNRALIRKHGLREFYECITGYREIKSATESNYSDDLRASEKDVVRGLIKTGSVLELGCGAEKTVEDAVGIDLIPMGETIPYLGGEKSVADIVGDAEAKLPLNGHKFDNVIARHLLEHCIDTVKSVSTWSGALADKGRLVISVPDHRLSNTIPLNPQHVHGFTPESLDSVCKTAGLVLVGSKDNYNGVSFTRSYEKR